MSQNNLDNQEMIGATQFSTMCGPVAVGDPWIWAIHSTANHPSCHPGWVKLSVGWVKFYIYYNHIEILCYLSKYSQNGRLDRWHEKLK